MTATRMSCATSELLDEFIALAQRSVPYPPRVVAIDGAAGSGKTTIAALLLERLGEENASVVHMDDLYPGWDGLAEAPSLLVEHVLAPLHRGEEGRFRRWDWHADARADEIVVPRSDWVVVEGVGCGSRDARAYLSALLFMEAEHDVRMRRGIERDGEGFRPHWERWACQEAALFEAEQTRSQADMVIRT